MPVGVLRVDRGGPVAMLTPNRPDATTRSTPAAASVGARVWSIPTAGGAGRGQAGGEGEGEGEGD